MRTISYQEATVSLVRDGTIPYLPGTLNLLDIRHDDDCQTSGNSCTCDFEIWLDGIQIWPLAIQ